MLRNPNLRPDAFRVDLKNYLFIPIRRIFAIVLFASVFGSCSTDFDVIAPYKEVIVLDGLINVFDSVQQVRISKAYLGEGDAYVMAQQKDSINFGNVLKVTMTELSTGAKFDLTRSEPNNKDTGIFNSPFVVLYKTNHPIDPNSKYKIDVADTTTGVAVYSETKVVGDIFITPAIQDPVDFASSFNFPVYVTYQPGKNSFIHELKLRFHYREIDPNGNTTYHSVDWNLGSPTTINSQEAKYVFYKAEFFELLENNIPDIQPGYYRRVDSLQAGIKTIEYIFTEGSEDLQTYIQLNQPSTGVVTEKPLFSTVVNGVGLFSSRLTHLEFRDIDQDTKDYIDNNLSDKGFQF